MSDENSTVVQSYFIFLQDVSHDNHPHQHLLQDNNTEAINPSWLKYKSIVFSPRRGNDSFREGSKQKPVSLATQSSWHPNHQKQIPTLRR